MKNEQLSDEVQESENKFSLRKYVQIPTKVFAFGSKYFLENDELLVYYVLGTMVLAKDLQRVECNIDLLYSKMNFGYFGFTDDSKNKKRIRTALTGLHDKSYILLSDGDKAMRNNTLLDIFIPKIDSSEGIEVGSFTFKGWENVYFELFDLCKGSGNQCVNHFKVLIYIQWREKIGFKIALSQWEQVLDVSNKTADKIIDECIEARLIHKERGQFYLDAIGKPKQETNSYSIVSKEEREVSESNKPSLEKKVNSMVKATTERLKTTETRQSKMFTQDKLEFNDYYIWKTTDCEVFKAQGKRRYDAILGTSAAWLLEKWEKEYQDKLEEGRKRKQQGEIAKSISVVSKQMMDDKPYVYKKKEDSSDRSWFLEDTPEKSNEDNWLQDIDNEMQNVV